MELGVATCDVSESTLNRPMLFFHFQNLKLQLRKNCDDDDISERPETAKKLLSKGGNVKGDDRSRERDSAPTVTGCPLRTERKTPKRNFPGEPFSFRPSFVWNHYGPRARARARCRSFHPRILLSTSRSLDNSSSS